MSQTVSYKTGFKELADIWAAINDLIEAGVFGPEAKLNTRTGDEPFDVGVYHHGNPEKKKNIIMRVTGGSEDVFGKGFYSGGGNGFAIEQDPATGEINLLLDLDYQSEITPATQAKIDKVRQKINDMVKVHEDAHSILRNFEQYGIRVTNKSEMQVDMEVELTEEQITRILGGR